MAVRALYGVSRHVAVAASRAGAMDHEEEASSQDTLSGEHDSQESFSSMDVDWKGFSEVNVDPSSIPNSHSGI